MDLIKNIEKATPIELAKLIEYQKGGIASKCLTYSKTVDITLMAVDKGEELSTHSADGDAFVVMIEGEALITVDGKENHVKAGEVILMPFQIPHSLKAIEPFKFMLTVVYPATADNKD